ncbi:MAG: redoxin domain-containing protein [Chloroflexi bacterium]|nr:redoxin domain-containing protein [Chloroflexota bacterium]MYC02395.1 redoxin domain-containing protein [Chloroflexota bacterium]
MERVVIGVGDQLPDTELSLREYLSDGPLLILFFMEANTPLCTVQLCAFRDDEDMISALGASVVAVSSDPPWELGRFDDEHQFPFPLLSDPALEAAEAFGVIEESGKRAQRAAFVADAQGTIQLAIPFYQPNNLDDYQEIFVALGLDV